MKRERRAYPALAAVYTHLIPTLSSAAHQAGYCLAVHGSMATDLDLIAVPWVDRPATATQLVEDLRHAVGGHIKTGGVDPFDETNRNPVQRMHGRQCWAIHFNEEFKGPYIDLTVMPVYTPAFLHEQLMRAYEQDAEEFRSLSGLPPKEKP